MKHRKEFALSWPEYIALSMTDHKITAEKGTGNEGRKTSRTQDQEEVISSADLPGGGCAKFQTPPPSYPTQGLVT